MPLSGYFIAVKKKKKKKEQVGNCAVLPRRVRKFGREGERKIVPVTLRMGRKRSTIQKGNAISVPQTKKKKNINVS